MVAAPLLFMVRSFGFGSPHVVAMSGFPPHFYKGSYKTDCHNTQEKQCASLPSHLDILVLRGLISRIPASHDPDIIFSQNIV